ncbi:uncharacterized protein LOC117654301 [Thrips palmi]|uniref:Uncharacterized protein LOC117654301 n=1 Tax=Thrips palmi TaxID=161013 RepID=A0A6P9AMH2_THRPL|nr:uncharacterized protein LOC117654301 [Thrips palmi]
MPAGRTSTVSWLASLLVFIAALEVARCRSSAHQGKKMVPVYYDIGACTDKQHFVEVNNVTTIMDEWGAYYCSASVLFLKEMKSVSKLVVIITKCTGGKATNLCEYYLRWVWTTALCRFIPARGMVWSPFYDSFDPPFNCPVKGHYMVRNATLDLDALKTVLPDLHKHIWPVEIQLFNESGELIVCMVLTAEFRHVKGKAVAGSPS